MGGFLHLLHLKTKLGFRSTELLITYYAVPLVFFAVMGAVFTSIMPEARETLIVTMTIFAVTMGALIGTPGSIMEYFTNDVRKSFRSAGIPLGLVVLAAVFSGLVHLSVVCGIIYIAAPLLFDAAVPAHLGRYLGGLLPFLLSTLLLGMLLGLHARSASRLTMYSQVVFLPSMMLSGIMFPSEMLPRPLELAGYVLPATHGMQLLTGETRLNHHLLLLLLFIGIFALLILLRIRQLRHEDRR